MRIELSGVRVVAGGHEILQVDQLALTPGEHIAIVGPSGAGKSSLVGLLLGWHRAAAGEVRVDGAPLDGRDIQALRQRTAWVDPSVYLWNRSLADNLMFGSRTAATPTALAALLDDADLRTLAARLPDAAATPLGEAGGLVSGGEGQRVRFGRALARPAPRLVMLDEPFRGLPRDRRSVLMARARARWRDATLLCVTHDIAETADFPRVLVVDGGRVVEDGAAGQRCARGPIRVTRRWRRPSSGYAQPSGRPRLAPLAGRERPHRRTGRAGRTPPAFDDCAWPLDSRAELTQALAAAAGIRRLGRPSGSRSPTRRCARPGRARARPGAVGAAGGDRGGGAAGPCRLHGLTRPPAGARRRAVVERGAADLAAWLRAPSEARIADGIARGVARAGLRPPARRAVTAALLTAAAGADRLAEGTRLVAAPPSMARALRGRRGARPGGRRAGRIRRAAGACWSRSGRSPARRRSVARRHRARRWPALIGALAAARLASSWAAGRLSIETGAVLRAACWTESWRWTPSRCAPPESAS